jgi:alpha-aminoadipate carrier protein LysW
MAQAACPVCEAEVPLDAKPVLGEIAQCPDCGSELELTKLDPPSFEKAPEMQEDWGE